jgi:hypothetical protein
MSEQIAVMAGANGLQALFVSDVTGDVSTIRDIPGSGHGVAISPNGRWLAVLSTSSPYLTVIDTQDWTTVPGISGVNSGYGDVTFSPNGQWLAVAHRNSPNLAIINTSDWSVVTGTPAIPNDANGVTFSSDSSLLAVGHNGAPYLTVINTSDWSVMSGTPALPDTGRAAAFSPGDQFLAVAHIDPPYLTVINTSDWSVVEGTPVLESNAHSTSFSESGAYLAVGHDGGNGLTILDTSNWSVIPNTPNIGLAAYGLAFADNDTKLICLPNGSPYLSVIDTGNWSLIPNTPPLESPGYAMDISQPGTVPVPSREVATKHYDGTDAAGTVTVMRRDFSVAAEIQTSGVATARLFEAGEFWLVFPDDRPGATSDAFARINLDATSGDLPPLVLTQGYIGDLVTISSNLTTQAGAAGDEVVIRNWTTRELVAKVIPDANGDWSAEVPPGTYDVSYIAENCAPVIHGPYTVELP